MRNILFAVLGLTASTVYANVPICAKFTADRFGECMKNNTNMESCIKTAATESTGCLKNLKHHNSEIQKKNKNMSDKERSNTDRCLSRSGEYFAECLVASFNIRSCTEDLIDDGYECYRVRSYDEHHNRGFEFEITNDFTACHKRCADELGLCLVHSNDPKSCFKKGNKCSLSCHQDLDVPKDIDSKIERVF